MRLKTLCTLFLLERSHRHARAPYFHNGSAASLLDVVNFYNTRFKLSLTDQQKSDLVAFLRTL